MTPKVYHSLRRFEKEVKTHYPLVQLEMIEPLVGSDASFRVTFPTPSWREELDKLHNIVLDIEEETGIWIFLLPRGPRNGQEKTAIGSKKVQMIPKVYHAVQRFEKEVKARYPLVQLELIEPVAGSDASFLATFPTSSWYEGLHQLNDIVLDIEEDTGVWIGLLPRGTRNRDGKSSDPRSQTNP